MGFAHVVIGSNHAALESREEDFGCVAVLEATRGDLFLRAMIDRAVTVKFTSYSRVNVAFISHQVRRTVYVGDDQSAQVFCRDVGDVRAANLPVTFN